MPSFPFVDVFSNWSTPCSRRKGIILFEGIDRLPSSCSCFCVFPPPIYTRISSFLLLPPFFFSLSAQIGRFAPAPPHSDFSVWRADAPSMDLFFFAASPFFKSPCRIERTMLMSCSICRFCRYMTLVIVAFQSRGKRFSWTLFFVRLFPRFRPCAGQLPSLSRPFFFPPILCQRIGTPQIKKKRPVQLVSMRSLHFLPFPPPFYP